jgi:hypothetical protein
LVTYLHWIDRSDEIEKFLATSFYLLCIWKR